MKIVKHQAKHVEKWIIGIDEVGRGPLAGPITMAAVAMPAGGKWLSVTGKLLKGIRDSKKLTPLARKKWDKIIQVNFPFATASVNVSSIDSRGISFAARLSIGRCLEKLSKVYSLKPSACHILLDGGLYAPPQYKNQQTIIKGDELHPIISAASISPKFTATAT